LTTRSGSIRHATLAGFVALPFLAIAGCGRSEPPAAPLPSKAIEKQLDSKDPKDRLEGAKQAEKIYGNGDTNDKSNSPTTPPSETPSK
jgi:hypothetical protein